MGISEYSNALRLDAEISEGYYCASLNKKTEQQKALENILMNEKTSPLKVADIACGGGGVSVGLADLFPNADFLLVDSSENAVHIAKKATSEINANCVVGDIYNLPICSDSCDLVVCWQTLSWLEDPQSALIELIRICKPKGMILASSLFNLKHDVDVYSKVIDYTRPSSESSLGYQYNTYSYQTVKKWLTGLASDYQFHEFIIQEDLIYAGRGLGTFTVNTESGGRLQISAGMLLNWGVLQVTKL